MFLIDKFIFLQQYSYVLKKNNYYLIKKKKQLFFNQDKLTFDLLQ